MIRWFR